MRRIVLVLLATSVVGCAAKRVQTTQVEQKPSEPVVTVTPVKDDNSNNKVDDTVPQFKGDTLHFTFNESTLLPESTESLQKLADVMRQNKSLRVNIAGNCDERGTTEYNLALGQQRAEAAKKYLVTLGVPESRISTISYGEEQPVAQGHSEEAWAQNRRDAINPQ